MSSSQRRNGAFVRQVMAIVAAALMSSTLAAVSLADDLEQVAGQLASAPDFRVRTNAALALGRSRNERALAALEKALDDRHPAVRAAAAAGIGALGQVQSLPALRQRAARERKPRVRAQVALAIAALEAVDKNPSAAKPRPAKVVIKLGDLQNLSGVRGARGAQVGALFRGATRARAGALPGVEVVGDPSDALPAPGPWPEPMLMLDGVVVRLVRARQGERVTVSAAVEYVFRKMPEHALRGSISGAAQALGSSTALTDRARVAVLEDQALRGAVDSAMRGAPEAMEQALR